MSPFDWDRLPGGSQTCYPHVLSVPWVLNGRLVLCLTFPFVTESCPNETPYGKSRSDLYRKDQKDRRRVSEIHTKDKKDHVPSEEFWTFDYPEFCKGWVSHLWMIRTGFPVRDTTRDSGSHMWGPRVLCPWHVTCRYATSVVDSTWRLKKGMDYPSRPRVIHSIVHRGFGNSPRLQICYIRSLDSVHLTFHRWSVLNSKSLYLRNHMCLSFRFFPDVDIPVVLWPRPRWKDWLVETRGHGGTRGQDSRHVLRSV